MAKPQRSPAPQGQAGSATYIRTGTPSLEVVPDMAALEASAVFSTPGNPELAPPEDTQAQAPSQPPAPSVAPQANPPTEAVTSAPAPEQPAGEGSKDPLVTKWESMTEEQRAESWRNAQQLVGKHGEEIGILRKAVDRFASTPIPTAAPITVTPKEPPTNLADDSALVTELLTNPTKVIMSIMDRAEERVIGKLKSQTTEQQIMERRARDLPLLQQSPEAAAWISKVPKELIEKADKDPEMWDFLMSTAPIRRLGAPQPAAPAQQVPRAPVALGNVGAPSAAAKPAQTGKVWTRREIGALYINNPDEYALRSDEIARAYAEQRVRD